MARRRREEEHENHERWLVSYADFITLLFAFFVVMYAISQVNEGKYRVLSDALLQAFKPADRPPARLQPEPRRDSQPAVVPLPIKLPADANRRRVEAKMKGIADDIRKVLEPLVKEGQVRVTESPRGIAVEINASVLFASGQAELNEDSIRSLVAVAQVLAGPGNAIEVEGHTDNSPIGTTLFPSNWELSAARASRVVRLFTQAGVAPERMSAVGYGEYRNVDTNDTPEGRARNRRVTVMILPAGEGGPAPTEAPAPEEPAQTP
ncbi:MAG: flagellar motor protein MotD [Burkholderiales bacterium]|nr:flagellar motor protein MotD [Burkholderiales bacterium]